MSKREIEAWAIFGPRRQKPHLDKLMASPAECWGLLADEQVRFPTGKGEGVPRIVDLRRKGYSCRKVKITWENVRRG